MERSSNKKKEREHEQILHGYQKRKISNYNTATNTENPLWNYVTPPTSTNAMSVDCTELESIPDVSTPINQKPTPKQYN